MGNQALKKREAARIANRKAKKEAAQAAKQVDNTSTSVDSPIPAEAIVSKTKGRKLALPKEAAPVRRSNRPTHSASDSAPSASSQDIAAHLAPRPRRPNAGSALAQLVHAEMDEESEAHFSDDEDEQTDYDLDHIVGRPLPESVRPDVSVDVDVDIGEIQLSPNGQLSLAAPKQDIKSLVGPRRTQKKGTKRAVEECSESDDDAAGEYVICHPRSSCL